MVLVYKVSKKKLVLIIMLSANSTCNFQVTKDGQKPIISLESRASLPLGYGPRHLAISEQNATIYVLNELQPFITVFSMDEKTGSLKEMQIVKTVDDGRIKGKTLANLMPGSSEPSEMGSEVELHPSGKFLPTSHRSQR